MKLIDSEDKLNFLLSTFEGKKYYTNSYFFGNQLLELVKNENLYYIFEDSNLIILIQKNSIEYFELYYYLQDLSKTPTIDTNAPIVMEIPYRGNKFYPNLEVDYWCLSGFKMHINRDLMSLVSNNFESIVLNSETLFQTQIIDDLKYSFLLCNAIKHTFDYYTGDILSVTEVEKAINNKEIIGVFQEKNLAGFLRFYEKNSVSWIGHIIIFPEFMGKGAGKILVKNYLKIQSRKGIKLFQHWVVSDNVAAHKLYENLGFKKINKSSISLLKTH